MKLKRDDISQFLVHLTRDTEEANENSAEENLLSILESGDILAFNHHCLFSPVLNKESDELQVKFNTLCLTETPLNKICHLLDVKGRQIKLQPYGLVFLKESIVESGGNPCLYTNGDENKALEKYLWALYNKSLGKDFEDDFYRIGAITNTFKKSHDFSWEREWRVFGKFHFNSSEVFAIISSNEDIKVPRRYRGIPIIDPNWGYEEIVYNLSIQLWKTRKGS